MLAVVQRVSEAKVTVKAKTLSQINQGFLILLAVVNHDTQADIDYLVKKISQLRIMADKHNQMNLSLKDVNGQVLVVPQFTLAATTKKGNRPSFVKAAPPSKAKQYFHQFVSQLQATGLTVDTGQFAADMQVSLLNDGPVTLILDSKNK